MERPSNQYEDIQIRNLDTGDEFNLQGEFDKLQLDLQPMEEEVSDTSDDARAPAPASARHGDPSGPSDPSGLRWPRSAASPGKGVGATGGDPWGSKKSGDLGFPENYKRYPT